jgi:Fe2+ or Zn2+ uptake regulation protein
MSIYVRRKTTAEVLGDRAEHEITEDYLHRRMAEQREAIMAAMVREGLDALDVSGCVIRLQAVAL